MGCSTPTRALERGSPACRRNGRILLVILFPRHMVVVTRSDFNTPGPPMTVSARPYGQHFADDQRYPGVFCLCCGSALAPGSPHAYVQYCSDKERVGRADPAPCPC